MKTSKTSFSLCGGTIDILDALRARHGMSRSGFVRHLIISQGIDARPFKLSTVIDDLPERRKDAIIREIHQNILKMPPDPKKPDEAISDLACPSCQSLDIGYDIKPDAITYLCRACGLETRVTPTESQ